MSKIPLISPDDGTVLQSLENYLIDESGNKYPIKQDIPDLRPHKPITGMLQYHLLPHEYFRSFPYRKSLTPLFPKQQTSALSFKEKTINNFIPPPEPQAKCLDHGCGSGQLRLFMEAKGYEYIGVDNESGVTTEQGGGKQFQGGATHLCDLHKLPFPENSFQFSVSYSVFEHLQNPFVAASELFRVMKPGGISFVAVASIIPFHMDSFYHHTHFGLLNTFATAGFEIDQVAGADWNAYVAISAMDGLPGPKFLRYMAGHSMYQLHRFLWRIRTIIKRRDQATEELRRHLMMAGIIKAILIKPHK